MKTAAIICEYNPFHNGHKYQIDQTRKEYGVDAVVALMSGNFVQRGDVAIFNKHARANAAICGGVDLVLELPTVFAMQSAEFFAKHAVFILNSLASVDYLSFGAECENLEQLKLIAETLINESSSFSQELKSQLSSGAPFPLARQRALAKALSSKTAELLTKPNNILAVEYLKALKTQDSKIEPILIHRHGADHHSTAPQDGFASASYIRSLLLSGKISDARALMPTDFEGERMYFAESMEKAIIAELIKMPADELRQISDVSEGIENRIKEKALNAQSLSQLADEVKTKRYAHSRIRRILLSAYLGITDDDRKSSAPYVKILAHNEKGQSLIRKMKKAAFLPLVRNTSQINKLNNPFAKAFWERERTFDALYELF